uniref:Regulator of G protein signaling 2 n=1 Tax=Cyprinodon variegatus TaxID=28743 RepID=A0A3Q2CME9_CYPVA
MFYAVLLAIFVNCSCYSLNSPAKVCLREKTYETDLLGDSLETVLSKKSNFLLLSGISKVMSWLATAVFIKLLCSFSVKGGQRAFRDFLKTEFCEENLDFWLACKEYQTCDSQERRTQMAARIYDEFIRNNSPKQVNLDFHTKETIRQSLEKPSLSCFRVAEKKIYILMENCSFPPKLFYKSRDFQAHSMKVTKEPPQCWSWCATAT